MVKYWLKHVLSACMLFALHTPSYAGRACDNAPPDASKTMQALELAHKTQRRLEEANPELAIIARVGQDLSKYHLRYSHLGLIQRDADGHWNVLHELKECGTANSDLYDEGLGDFFLDDMFAFETMILIPAPALQQKLQAIITSGMARKLHQPAYNMLAYPFATQYQNSNQWALEVLATAQASDVQVSSRRAAQAWLKLVGYEAQTLEIPAMTRLGARLFRANVAFDDQPFERRMAGQIDTVTVESIARFLMRRDSLTQKIIVTL